MRSNDVARFFGETRRGLSVLRRRHRVAERLWINRYERRQIKVDDVRKGPVIEGGRVSRQDEEIARAGGRDIPEPDSLAREFLGVPSFDSDAPFAAEVHSFLR